jgi:hypothetical protein
VTAAAQRLQAVFPKWELLKADENTQVNVGGKRGYRLVLEQGIPRPAVEHQFPTKHTLMVNDYDHIQFVLFPKPVADPLTLRDQIPWLELKQQSYVRPVYAGEGLGYYWFVYGSIWRQDLLRKQVNLQGGEDTMEILASGLTIRDDGNYTSNTCVLFLADAGDRALPYIERVIEEHSDPPRPAFGALSHNSSEASTKLLLQCYTSNNPVLSQLAEGALAIKGKGYRPSAKEAYLNMLRGRRDVEAAAGACVEFGWTEAIPLLQAICEKPDYLRQDREAYEAKRALEGNPIPQELKEAEETILRSAALFPQPADLEKVPAAKATILKSPDPEAAVVIATGVALAGGKNREDFLRKTGLELLQQLPRPLAYDFVRRMADSIQSEIQHPKLARLAQTLAPQQ